MEGYRFHNWALTYQCSPQKYFEPDHVDQLREIIRDAREQSRKVRFVGVGHSPSDLCCTNDYLVSMRKFNRILNIDEEKRTVKAQAGVLLKDLVKELKDRNLALGILPAMGDFTLAGLVSTGTHGSGVSKGIMADHVTSMTILTADNRLLTCSREDNSDIFHAVCGGLGTLGAILAVEMEVEPYYNLKNIRYPMLFDDFLDSVNELCSESEYFRAAYFPYTDNVVVSSVSRSQIIPQRRSPSLRDRLMDLFQWFLFSYLLEFLYFLSIYFPFMVGVANRLVYNTMVSKFAFMIDGYERISFFNTLYHQVVSEWNIPRDRCPQALRKLRSIIERGRFPAHVAVEIRFIRRDSFWLSPAYDRDVCAINIITYCPYDRQPGNWKEFWTSFADMMKSLDGRPHLAKTHNMTRKEMSEAYPKFEDFLKLRQRLDPDQIFVNDYIKRVLGPEEKVENVRSGIF